MQDLCLKSQTSIFVHLSEFLILDRDSLLSVLLICHLRVFLFWSWHALWLCAGNMVF